MNINPLNRNPKDPWGDPEGVVTHPAMLIDHASIIGWAKDIASVLERYYPGWLWGIKPDSKGRMITISAFRVSNDWGYAINLVQTPIEDAGVRRRVAIRAGGEYLERFGVRPGPFNREGWLQMTRYAHGDARPDTTDMHASIQRKERDEALDKGLREGAIDLKIVDSGGQRHLWVK